MKLYFLSFLFITGLAFVANAQNQKTDSLKQLLKTVPVDSNKVKLLLKIAVTYYFSKPDSCLVFADEALAVARRVEYMGGEVEALNTSGEALRFLGNYPLALKMQMDALLLNRKMKDTEGEAASLGFIGFTYVEFREYRQGLQYLQEARTLNKQAGNQLRETFDLTNIGNAYDLMEMPDSALYYQQLAYKRYTGLNYSPLKSLLLTRYGNAYAGMGKKDSALTYFQKALQNTNTLYDKVNNSKTQRKIAELYESSGQYDLSLYYARQSIISGQHSVQRLEILETSNLLARLFRKTKNNDSAFLYLDIAKAMTDSLYGPKKIKELQLLMLSEQQQQQQIMQEQQEFRNRIKYIALLSALGVFLLLAFLLLRNNRQKQKANNKLQEQKNKIELTLTELKSTQAQLIQSEKMASLGELTAGIAHEIQNPLNFVNNFSDINKELLAELKEEADKGNISEIKTIANDIIDNEEKINHHGKRADSIVKGMLQHSRSSSGVKEPTDINALADEYLRLAYHGMRGKDKSFNATMQTGFDPGMGKINIISQDIGRVLLNLYNNAFYAVNEKKKSAVDGYEPIVSVTTKRTGDKISIFVKDNGNGIPQNILDKIFQPFFTTKPTGQGTGLGLSLAYDIVKAHGGEIKAETRQREFSEFIITLPV